MASIRERLESLRGEAYYDEWRVAWQEIRDDALAATQFIETETGQITARDLVEIADLFGTPFKTLVEQLEGEGVIALGTYELLRTENFSVSRTRREIAQEREAQATQQARRESELTSLAEFLQDGIFYGERQRNAA